MSFASLHLPRAVLGLAIALLIKLWPPSNTDDVLDLPRLSVSDLALLDASVCVFFLVTQTEH